MQIPRSSSETLSDHTGQLSSPPKGSSDVPFTSFFNKSTLLNDPGQWVQVNESTYKKQDLSFYITPNGQYYLIQHRPLLSPTAPELPFVSSALHYVAMFFYAKPYLKTARFVSESPQLDIVLHQTPNGLHIQINLPFEKAENLKRHLSDLKKNLQSALKTPLEDLVVGGLT
jgi:hypothetical protein